MAVSLSTTLLFARLLRKASLQLQGPSHLPFQSIFSESVFLYWFFLADPDVSGLSFSERFTMWFRPGDDQTC